MRNSSSPVNPQASASRNVLQDMRKNSAVSSNGKSLSLVNLVTWKGVNESNFRMNKPLNTLFYINSDNHVERRIRSIHDADEIWTHFFFISTMVQYQQKKKVTYNIEPVKDINAVTTPVAIPRAKEPLKTPRKMPKDFSMAMASNVWLLFPSGWYATIDLEKGHRHIQVVPISNLQKSKRIKIRLLLENHKKILALWAGLEKCAKVLAKSEFISIR